MACTPGGYLWLCYPGALSLTHWGRDKTTAICNDVSHWLGAIPQTTFSNAFSWMTMFEFRLRFHWNLFLRFELTISNIPALVQIMSLCLPNPQIPKFKCFSSLLAVGLCAIYWSQVLSGAWRCSWSSADRRRSNYIWVINNLIAY